MSRLAEIAPSVLAWKPFLQPAPGVEHWWWVLVIPTAVGVALAYKSTRTRELALLPRDVLRMSVQIVLAMVGIAVFLYLLVMVLLPRLPVE
ncbi:MAG: hypothetical protein RLY21_1079 [Planctomycetota bacterium]